MREFFNDKHLQSNPYVNWFELYAVLQTLWFILSAIFEHKFILFGVLSSMLISLYCVNAFRIEGLKTEKTYFILHVNPFRFFAYFGWLLKEIAVSAATVSCVIFSGRKALHPHVVWFKADYDNPAARALLANSITLTPGTVTIDIGEDGVFSVHALNKHFAEGLLEGTMQRKIAALFAEDIDFRVVEVVQGDGEAVEEVVRLRPGTYEKRKDAR